MNKIIPGILEENWSEIEKKLLQIKLFTNTVHIDIIDGIFAPNKTFLDPAPFAKYSKELFLEVHLMTDNPLQYLKPFAAVGFKRFIGQIEKMPDVVEFIAEGEGLGEVGLAIDSATPIESINVSLEDLDFLLIMGIKAGASGQVFLPEILEKIKQIRTKNENIVIEVDGGINDQTILDAKNAGANRFVSTSFIFNSPSLSEAFLKLSNLA